MKHTVMSISVLLLGASLGSAAEGVQVGIINMQEAIASTKDGLKAAAGFNAKFEPVRQKLARKEAEIQAGHTKLNQGGNAMSAEQREKLIRDLDQKTKILKRETEDASAEQEQEQARILQELGQKVMAVIDKYSKDNGYALVLDVSSQQTPVLFATHNITADVVKQYDQKAPRASAGKAPAGGE